MLQDDQLLKDFISKLPAELLQSPETQKMALDLYYKSVTNVLCNNKAEDEVNKLLEKTKKNGGSLEAMRNEIPDFDDKVFEEFTKLVKDMASHDARA